MEKKPPFSFLNHQITYLRLDILWENSTIMKTVVFFQKFQEWQQKTIRSL